MFECIYPIFVSTHPNNYILYFFFFNDTATTEIYTLSLHDALPILNKNCRMSTERLSQLLIYAKGRIPWVQANLRSEEHTSELQSPCNLVCRLLLEKKKQTESATACDATTRLS